MTRTCVWGLRLLLQLPDRDASAAERAAWAAPGLSLRLSGTCDRWSSCTGAIGMATQSASRLRGRSGQSYRFDLLSAAVMACLEKGVSTLSEVAGELATDLDLQEARQLTVDVQAIIGNFHDLGWDRADIRDMIVGDLGAGELAERWQSLLGQVPAPAPGDAPIFSASAAGPSFQTQRIRSGLPARRQATRWPGKSPTARCIQRNRLNWRGWA